MPSLILRSGSPALVLLVLACGAAKPSAESATPSASASSAAPAASAPPERPFAHTALEAQTLIQDQIDHHMKTLWKCVDAYRAKTGDPHKALAVDIGIDQEGSLLGVAPASTKQGDLEPTLKQCLWDGLHGLLFPRSHAGVITVRQSFTDSTVTQ